MDSLVNLNDAVTNFLDQGDVEAVQRCVEYSLSSKRLLQAVFDKKSYDCIVPIAPILREEFYDKNPIAIDICVDLLERKEALSVLPLPSLNQTEILQRAVARRVCIDFSLRYKGRFLFDEKDKEMYYRFIVTTDCLELFMIYEAEIMKNSGERICQAVVFDFFPRILKAISRTEDWCKKSLSIVLKTDFLKRYKSEHYEELLLHLYDSYDCRAKVYKHLFVKTQYCYLFHYKTLLKIAASHDERIAPKLKEVKPELHAELFEEDV